MAILDTGTSLLTGPTKIISQVRERKLETPYEFGEFADFDYNWLLEPESNHVLQ
jgi:hypothetical protein